jgi:hypothetical protein
MLAASTGLLLAVTGCSSFTDASSSADSSSSSAATTTPA